MSATYEPGTVAVATVRGVPNVRVMRSGKGWQGETWHADSSVTDVRPLVVLDPEGIEASVGPLGLGLVERLRLVASTGTTEGFAVTRKIITAIADQIEAQTRPPKPAEPTGLGAVVEDAEGVLWVRNPDADVHCKWRNRDQQWRNFAAIDAVRVLSEGVTQ